MDENLNIFVSPYGKLHQVQYGVNVKPPKSLKETLTTMADASEYDLNPEACTGLRKVLTRG